MHGHSFESQWFLLIRSQEIKCQNKCQKHVNVGNPAKLIVINKPIYMSIENGFLWGLSQLTLETAILQKHSIMKGSFTEALI